MHVFHPYFIAVKKETATGQLLASSHYNRDVGYYVVGQSKIFEG